MGCCADKKDKCCGISKVVIPAALGGHDGEYAPQNGAYQNTLVYYEASGVSYLYANDGSFEKLADGIAATIEIGETTTLTPGSDVTVENVGTKYHAKLNFGIPQGEKGDAATISVGSTTTGSPGTDASVTNSGDEHDAVFDFVIPRGDKGDQGDAATINVGTVTTTTLEPGEQASATVTNSGTTENAVLDFGFDIPKGEKGDTGATGSIKSELADPLPATGQEDTYYLTNDSATKGTATGNPIQLNLANQGKIEELKLNGNATQQTYSGKNLFSTGFSTDFSANASNTFTLHRTDLRVTRFYFPTDLPAGTYTFSFKIASNTTTGGIYFSFYDVNNQSIGTIVGAKTTPFSSTITFSADLHMIYAFINSNEASDKSITLTDFQIEAGSTATDYEPYVGGTASPNPDYPQDINVVTGEQNVEVVGKNLFGGLEITGVTRCTATLNGTTLTVTPINTTQTTAVTLSLGSKIPAGTYTLNSATFLSNTTQLRSSSNAIAVYSFGSNYSNQTFTIEEVVDGIRFNWNAASSTDPFTVDLSTLQIELGNTATTYEAYSATDYEVNLGKNLLTLDGITPTGNAYITYAQLDGNSLKLTAQSGIGAYSDKTFTYSMGQLGLSVGDTISIQMDMTGDYASRQCRVYYNSISTLATTLTPTESKKTITIPSGTTSILLLFYVANGETPTANSTATYSNIMIEKSAAPTDFAPYFTPIELAKIGTYQDYIWNDGGTWKVHKAVGKVVLTGSASETWGSFSGSFAHYVVASDAKQLTGVHEHGEIVSNYFTATDYYELYYGNADYGISLTYNQSRITFRNKDCADLAAFKTWLSSHNTTVYYALATPTDTAITEQALIDQLNAVANAQLYSGQNNIMNLAVSPNLAGDLEIGYASWVPGDRYDVYIWNDDTGWQIIHTADS